MVAHAVTLSRLVLSLAFALCVFFRRDPVSLSSAAAITLIALAIVEELTDIFDGVVARRLGTACTLGGLLDPLVDSLSRLTIYFAMAFAGWISFAVPLVMVGRDIIVAYTRIIGALTGGKISARLSGKFKAIIQGGGIVVIVLLTWLLTHGGPGADISVLRVIHPGIVTTLRLISAGILITVTLWSLLDYVKAAWPSIRQMAANEE